MSALPPQRSERAIVFCIGAVQFVNILDFVIVMPLGPDFASALKIPLSHLGYVGGSYTAAACVSGFAGAFFLDRFDRRKALAVAMLGLTLGTLAGAFAQGLVSLMAARIIAGMFGGPATSVAYSIIADVIPAERRGKAMGAVMGALSVASILGIPAGLELARRGSWKLPFIAVAVLGALIGTFAHAVLPPMFAHLGKSRTRSTTDDLRALARNDVFLSLTMTFVAMAAGFILIPNMTAYLLKNLQYPRSDLGTLYLIGGVVSFIAMRVVGWLVDKFGSARVGMFGALFIAAVTFFGFVEFPPMIPPILMFVGFMLGNSFRNVSYNTLTSKVPSADERARFGSVQSAVQHLSAALASFASAQLLTEREDGTLEGIQRVATISMVLGLGLIPLFFIVEARVKRKLAAASASAL